MKFCIQGCAEEYHQLMELFDILYPLGVFFFAWIWAWSFTHFID